MYQRKLKIWAPWNEIKSSNPCRISPRRKILTLGEKANEHTQVWRHNASYLQWHQAAATLIDWNEPPFNKTQEQTAFVLFMWLIANPSPLPFSSNRSHWINIWRAQEIKYIYQDVWVRRLNFVTESKRRGIFLKSICDCW